jgi:chromosome segregation ATPase
MASKRELKKIRSDIQTSKNEYEQLVSKIKSERMLLLKVNNEMKEMDENTKKTKEEYQKQGLVIQEVNNSKKELSEIREEIKKYNNELELVKTKTENTPQLISLKEEKKKLEDEIMQKRKDVQTHVKELKFIQNEMIDTGNKERSTKVVDAASAVVASMNQKLQITLKELNEVKEALENERKSKR